MTRHDRNIWISISCADALAEREWLTGLGFEPGVCVTGPDGTTVQHSEMLWPEGGRVMVSTSADKPHLGTSPGTTSCYVVTETPDEVLARAVALGVQVIHPIEDTDYGSRGFSVLDPAGNGWSFGSYAG